MVVEVQAELNALVEGNLRLPIRRDTHSSYNSVFNPRPDQGFFSVAREQEFFELTTFKI
jgi:hypothetical protein